MAAGISELAVPGLFEEVLDGDSSSSNNYWSIASDGCFETEDNSFPFSKEVVLSALEDLEYGDEVSLIFLLTNDMSRTFHNLVKPHRVGEVFEDWLMSQEDGCWEEKLIEALCIIQNYEMLGNLVQNVLNEKIRFAPRSPNYFKFINCTRKALYLMCEALCAEELNEMVRRMQREWPSLRRAFSCEFMEINIMYWSCCQCISLGDGAGGVELHVLKSVLKAMNKLELVGSLESSTVYKDAPKHPNNSISTCSSKRFCVNPIQTGILYSPSSSCLFFVNPDSVGICLIINQKTFYKEPDPQYHSWLIGSLETREGTDVDRDRLWEVFRSMGFTILVKENLTHLQILDTVREVVMNRVEEKHSCFALCILSHGAEGMVSGSNSVAVCKYELDNCLIHAPNLYGKPILMVLQVCQGEKLQNVVYFDDVVEDGPTKSTVRRGIGEFANTLTFWSTMPGFASLRDTKHGSWFVEEFWQNFMSARTNEDITTMCTRVTNAVTNRSLLEDGFKTMVPEQCNRLTKTLILPHNPKYMLEVALKMFERFLCEALIMEYLVRRGCLAARRFRSRLGPNS